MFAIHAAQPLEHVSDLYKLSPVEIKKETPVHIQATVTCYDKRADLFFVQDATAGIYVFSPEADLKLTPGQSVTIEGRTSQGRIGPIIFASKVTAGTNSALPEPRLISMSRLDQGMDDSQWVELEGTVANSFVQWEQLNVELQHERQRARLIVLRHEKASALLFNGRNVRVRGVVGGGFDSSNKATGFHIYVPNETFILPTSLSPEGTTNTAIRPGASGTAEATGEHTESRTSLVQGTVSLFWPGRMLIVRDGARVYRAQPRDRVEVQPGDKVEMEGAVHRGRFSPLIRHASVRLIERAKSPEPVKTGMKELFSRHLDGNLVSVEARVILSPRHNTPTPSLLLELEGRTFEAMLPSTESLPRTLEGSVLRVTGVVETELEDPGSNDSLRMWIAAGNGIEVLSTPEHSPKVPLGWAVGIGILPATCMGGWLFLNNRGHVGKKGRRQLYQREISRLAAFQEPVVQHDLTGRIVWINPAAERLLGVSSEAIVGSNLTRIVAPQHWEKLREMMAGDSSSLEKAGAYELEIAGVGGETAHVRVACRKTTGPNGEALAECLLTDLSELRRTAAALRSSEQQLRESLRQQEEIARDLHDNIIQSLYAAGLGIEAARGLVRTQPQQAEDRLNKGVADLNHVLRDIRGFLERLTVESDPEHDLETSLQVLIITMSRTLSTRFVLDIDRLACGRLEANQVEQLVYIAREAMTNCLKHSKAKTAVVSFRTHESGLRFEIRDDGCGFDVATVAAQGHGLRNIATRAQRLNAAFEIQSQPGYGTTISLLISA